jgi:hypothetical protein
MSHVEALEPEIRRLPKEDMHQIYRWLADYFED